MVTLLLTMFAVGVGIGSLLSENLSRRRVELGLVPLGSLGLSVFGLDLIFAYQPPPVEQLMSIRQFLQSTGSLRLLADLMLIGVFGGLYIVPLYAFIQTRTSVDNRARTIAASNILGALFMVLSSVAGAVLLGPLGLSLPKFFLMLAVANLVVGLYIFSLMPEFLMHTFLWLITHTMYRIRHRGLEQIPDEGPVVIVCNHVSYIDWLIVAATIRRPVRFVMYAPIFRMPVINLFCRAAKAIPISSRRKEPATLRKAFMEISKALENGEVVCIFPEGKLTRTGEIDEFKTGIEVIIRRNPAPVIPMALRGMWGSIFSHANGSAPKHRPRRFWSKIALVAGAPIAPQTASAQNLQNMVSELKGPYK